MSNRSIGLALVVVALVATGISSLWKLNGLSAKLVSLEYTAPAVDPVATELELPPKAAESPTIDPPASATISTVPAPASPAEEDENAFKRRTFKNLLDQFDGVPLEKPDWPGFDRQKMAPILMVMAVAAHMDRAGTSTPELGDGVTRPLSDVDGVKYDHYFSYNGREYRFMRGDFPLFDEYTEHSSLDPATQASFDEPEPPRGYSYPEEFFARASQFAHGALALR